MMTRLPRRAVLTLAASSALPTCATASGPTVMTHPRLFITPSAVARARGQLAADPQGQAVQAGVLAAAETLLKTKLQPRDFEPRRPVLLPTMRAILVRIQTLGVAHALSGDTRYATRGIAELLNLCAFADWNPSHFLDVAEGGHAAAIGYDWFFSLLTPDQRATVRDAILAKSLRPARLEYDRRSFWTKATHNWNIVCNAGVTLAALAVLDDAPDIAIPLITQALVNVRQGFSSYHQDGGWGEGPGYWQYATDYAVYLLAALETSGWPVPPELIGQPGYTVTGGFATHMTGPTGRVFNFADGGPTMGRTPALLWLAARFNRPQDCWSEQRQTSPARALNALWHQPQTARPPALDAAFPDISVASFRGSWTDRNAVWLAIKGGDNSVNHGDLNLGAFVLEYGGQRFAACLGADDYALPGYFSTPQRFTYLRTASRGQNVLLLGAANQALGARAPLRGFRAEPDFARTVVDLTQANPGVAHLRGAALIDRRHAVIVDECHTEPAAALVWQMLTQAMITPNGTSARLTLGGATLIARLIDPPEGAVFAEETAAAAPPENPNTGYRKLVVRLPPGNQMRLVVLFSPDGAMPPDPTSLRAPLATWV